MIMNSLFSEVRRAGTFWLKSVKDKRLSLLAALCTPSVSWLYVSPES